MKTTKDLYMTDTGHMGKEITSQPQLWKDTYDSILAKKDEIAAFFRQNI